MKIAILIPDRGDRPEFLENCLRMIKRQTLQPAFIELVNDPPLSGEKDITYRYRIGYSRLSEKPVDLIAFMENDDWYHPEYLEHHAKKWMDSGMPNILGTNYTVYYHLGLKKYYTMYHDSRSSAMNTFLRPNQNIEWPADNEPYTDIHLWTKIRGVIWKPTILSVGMKHGLGMLGGFAHIDHFERYINDDNGFLHNVVRVVDEEGFQFYQKMIEKLNA